MSQNNNCFCAGVVRLIRKTGKYVLFYLSNPMRVFAAETVGVTADGIKYWCLHENLIERAILDSGLWEPAETNAVKEYVKPGDVVFDIGANIGYFSLLMSKQVGPAGQVHCFEPTSYAFGKLQRNVGLNPDLPRHNLKLNRKGLSSHCENVVTSFESRFSSKLLAYDESEKIYFVTLDSYSHSAGLDRLDFVKIDVDGYDYEVVKGGIETLSKYRPIVMAEICDRVLRENGISVPAYLELYLKCGYDSCRILGTPEIIPLEQFVKDPRANTASCNILVFRRG